MTSIWDFFYNYLKRKGWLKVSFSITCRCNPTQTNRPLQSTGYDMFIGIVLAVMCFEILCGRALLLFPFLFLVGLLGPFVKFFTKLRLIFFCLSLTP